MLRPALASLTVAAVLAAGLALPSGAGAVISPRTCGTQVYKEKRYLIRAHVISCSKAKRYARDYLVHRRKPPGWRCQRFDARTSKLAFRCSRSRADVFAIRK